MAKHMLHHTSTGTRSTIYSIAPRIPPGRDEGKRKREKGRGKREEGRGKREEGRGKREEGRGKREMDQGNESDLKLFERNFSHMTVALGQLRLTFRSLFGIRRAFWHTWITLGSLWAHFRVTLGVLWRHFGVTLCHFGNTSDE